MMQIKRIRGFLLELGRSERFIAALALMTVAFWASGAEIAGAAVFVFIGCLYLLIDPDLKPVLTVVMFITMLFSLTQIKTVGFTVFLGIAVPLIAISLTYNLIRFRGERKYKAGVLAFGMILALACTCFSGMFFSGYNKIWALVVLGVGLGIYLVYFLIVNCTQGDFATQIAKILFYAGLIVFAETVIWFLRQPDFIDAVVSKRLRVGWGMSNTMAVVFVMAVPASVMLGIKNKAYSFIMFPYIALMGVALLFTLSRGNILFGLPIIAASAIYGFIKVKNKYARIECAVIVLGIAAVLIFSPIIGAIFDRLGHSGFNPNGRDTLYRDAVERFKAHPLFGVGYFKPAGYHYPLDGPGASFLWKTHNTFFQILSCGGIVGVIGILPYFCDRYRMLLGRFDTLHFTALLSVLAYEAEGMLDVTFLSVHQLFFVLGLLAAIELENGKAKDGKPKLSLTFAGENKITFKKIFKNRLKIG